jgi:hypothetical protein
MRGWGLIPFEEMRVVDKVLHHEIARIAEIGGGLGDLVKRRDRGPKNVEDRKGDLSLFGGVNEADVAQRLQRGRHETGTHVDERHGGLGRIERVENLHLVGDERNIDDFGQLGVKALERATGCLGVKGTHRNLVGGEIIEESARDCRLAHPALVRPDDDDCWLCH